MFHNMSDSFTRGPANEMARVRGILLDFYGTVVHEDDVNIAEITALMSRHSALGTSEAAIGEYWYATFFEWCSRSFDDAFVSQRYLAVESLRETLAKFGVPLSPEDVIAPQLSHWMTSPIFADALPFLEHAKDLGLPVCIVSNVDRADIESATAAHGLAFAGLVTSEDARSYKPRPEMFERALDALNVTSREALHIGDSWSCDVRGAQALGMPVAWINRNGKSASSGNKPDWEVPDLANLNPILDQLLA
jgi:2-haloacid dehalogenase/putative hydrolase of the HAD superfamily